MTIIGKKNAVTKGTAKLLVRVVRPQNGPRPDWRTFYKPEAKPPHILVEFNTKDELELQYAVDRDDIPKTNKENINTINSPEGKAIKVENFKIDDIIDCIANETNDFSNTLVIETARKNVREDIVLKFESEQEFRRTLFTYKYFKMRNRLTNNSSSSDGMSDGSSSPSLSTKSKSSISSNDNGSVNNYSKSFDYSSNNGMSHYVKNSYSNYNEPSSQSYSTKSLDYITINGQTQKNKQVFEQKIKEMNELNMRHSKNSKMDGEYVKTNGNDAPKTDSKSKDIGEIDGLIYTDVEYESMDYPSMNYAGNFGAVNDMPLKPQRRKQQLRRIKGKAPPPPGGETEVVRGQVVKLSVERGEKVPTKDPDSTSTRNSVSATKVHIAASGYESDREEWRSRSTFSSSAFHSLARPARRALAAYYRLASPTPPAASAHQIIVKPSPRNPRNLQEYPKNFINPNPEFVILSQIQDSKRTNFATPNYQQDFNKIPYQKQELKYGKMLFNQEYKRNTLGGSMNYLNISNRLYGLTDKLKEIGSLAGQQNNAKMNNNWQSKPEKDKKEKGQLKPVIKKSQNQEGSKRPVVRTCSAEPPKKVTFSAFATVQVV